MLTQRFLGHTAPVSCMCVVKQRYIITGSDDRSVRVWHFLPPKTVGAPFPPAPPPRGKPKKPMYKPPEEEPEDPHGVVDVFAEEKERWTVQPGMLPPPQRTRIHTLLGHHAKVLCLAVVENFIFSGSWDTTIRKWDLLSGECYGVMKVHVSAVVCMHAPASDTVGEYQSDILCSGGADGTVCIWSIRRGELIRQLTGHKGWIKCLQVKGDRVVSGCADGTLRVWNNKAKMKCDELIFEIAAHTDAVLCLKLSKAGDWCATGSNDTTVKVWCMQTGRCLHEMEGHEASIQKVQLTPSYLISGDGSGVIRIWLTETGVCKHLLRGHKGGIISLIADEDADDCRIYSAAKDKTIRVWSSITGICHSILIGHSRNARCLALLPGKYLQNDQLVSAGDDNNIIQWAL